MGKTKLGIGIVIAATAALLFAGIATAQELSPKCVSEVDRAAGHLSRCLLRAESHLVKSENRTRFNQTGERCSDDFEKRVERAVRQHGEAACPQAARIASIGNEVVSSVERVAREAEGGARKVNPGCVTPDSMVPFLCDAEWVFCIDAICDDETFINEDGYEVASCKCWKQTQFESVLPTGSGGAACVLGYEGGHTMCEEMKAGSLYSTYAPGDGWEIPPKATASCDPGTPFAFCWGAKCQTCEEAGATNCDEENNVICDCPMVSTVRNQGGIAIQQQITPSAEACASQSNPCDHVHNSNPPGLSVGGSGGSSVDYCYVE